MTSIRMNIKQDGYISLINDVFRVTNKQWIAQSPTSVYYMSPKADIRVHFVLAYGYFIIIVIVLGVLL